MTRAPYRPISTSSGWFVPLSYRYVPGRFAGKVYETVPPLAAASRVNRHAPAGHDPPVALTPSCPGKTIETGTGRLLVRLTTTVSPSLAQSAGPGSWKSAVAVKP